MQCRQKNCIKGAHGKGRKRKFHKQESKTTKQSVTPTFVRHDFPAVMTIAAGKIGLTLPPPFSPKLACGLCTRFHSQSKPLQVVYVAPAIVHDGVHQHLTARMGGNCSGKAVGDTWPQSYMWHINLPVLLTVLWVFQHFTSLLEGRHVLVRTNECNAKAYINRQDRFCSTALLTLMELVLGIRAPAVFESHSRPQ